MQRLRLQQCERSFLVFVKDLSNKKNLYDLNNAVLILLDNTLEPQYSNSVFNNVCNLKRFQGISTDQYSYKRSFPKSL